MSSLRGWRILVMCDLSTCCAYGALCGGTFPVCNFFRQLGRFFAGYRSESDGYRRLR